MTKPTNHTEPCPHCHGTGKVFSDQPQGAQLRKERKAKGIKQTQVAKIMQCSIPYICQLEAGKRSWDFEKVKRYRKALTTKPKTK
jgi:predicted transcriptional regulator